MEYFVLQADKKLKEGQQSYRIPGCKNNMLEPITEMIPPTQASVINRKLEWLIPNNQVNQQHISLHYPHFKILEAGKESTATGVKLMDGMPKPVEPKAETKTKPSPQEIQKLKAERIAELKELGVEPPKNSSLPKLDELLAAKQEELLNS